MIHPDKASCRKALEELWTRWPSHEVLPPSLVERLEGCPQCRRELDEFRALCAAAATPDAKPLSWATLAPHERRLRLARSTRHALLTPARPAARPIVWAPALAFAALAIALLVNYNPAIPDAAPSRRRPVPIARAAAKPLEVPLEVIENSDFFENLDMIDQWDAVEAARREHAL